jgi:hypothetical protein
MDRTKFLSLGQVFRLTLLLFEVEPEDHAAIVLGFREANQTMTASRTAITQSAMPHLPTALDSNLELWIGRRIRTAILYVHKT